MSRSPPRPRALCGAARPAVAALAMALATAAGLMGPALPPAAAAAREVTGPAAGGGEVEHLVVLLRPTEIDELTREALARITGELAAARLRVVILPLDATTDPIEQVDSAGGDLAPVAAFALVRVPGDSGGSGAAVELWVSDRLAHRVTIQRLRILDGDVSRAAEVLAVESVEQIRISLAQLWPRPAAAAVRPREEPPAPPTTPQLSLALGVGVLNDFGPAAPFWSATARAGYTWPRGWEVFVAARGLGPSLDLEESDGGARVRRQAAWAGGARVFRYGQRVQPVLSLAAGAELVRAEGTASDPARARTRSAWVGMATAGARLMVRLAPHLALALGADGVVSFPPVVVRIGHTDAARFDRPALLLEGALRVSF